MKPRQWDGGAIGAAASGAGAAALATAAAACCTPVVAPLIVGVLGAGGAAWAAGSEPYSFLILAVAGVLLGSAYRRLYRPAPAAGGPECRGRRPLAPRLVLWVGVALWMSAALAHLAPHLSNLLLRAPWR
jgi:hypothetical protein